MKTKLAWAIALTALSFNAYSSNWPSQPIKLISAYPPGGPTDVMARLLAEPLSKKLGGTVIVENKPGAAGNIGTTYVARSKPDGYNILLVTSGSMSVNPFLFKNLSYNPQKDFEPIIQISKIPLVLEVNPNTKLDNTSQYIEHAKQNPDQVTYASASIGTPQHLAGALFAKELNLDMRHIPYQGAGPAVNDLAGGHVFSMFDILASSIPFLQNNRLKALAVTTKDRSPLLPHIPTLHESGVPNFDYYAWHGIVAPAGTPKEIINKYNTAFNEIFQDPEFQKKWSAIGSDVVGGTPESFTELINSETKRAEEIIKDSAIELE